MEDVANELCRAIRNGEAGDDTEKLQFVSDLLTSRHPDAPTPEKLEPFSVLCGACFALGVERSKR